jgi:hypothetical protein
MKQPQKLNRKFIRDAANEFLKDEPYRKSLIDMNGEKEAYSAGVAEFVTYLQELFPEEKNVHLSKDGDEQQLYKFHFMHGGLPTSQKKWMNRTDAEAYANKKGYRLELVRVTHK